MRMRYCAFPLLEEVFLNPESIESDGRRCFGLAMPLGKHPAVDIALALQKNRVLSRSQCLFPPLVPHGFQSSEAHFVFFLLQYDFAMMREAGGAEPTIERAAEKV